MDKSKLPEDLVVYHGIDFYKLKSRPDLKNNLIQMEQYLKAIHSCLLRLCRSSQKNLHQIESMEK